MLKIWPILAITDINILNTHAHAHTDRQTDTHTHTHTHRLYEQRQFQENKQRGTPGLQTIPTSVRIYMWCVVSYTVLLSLFHQCDLTT